jgi:hypothetical protein
MLDISIPAAAPTIAEFGAMPARVTRAEVRALNRAIGSARTAMTRAIAQDTGLKSGDVRKRLNVYEATPNRPEARLAASLKKVPLIDFGARASGHGVISRLRGGRGRIPNAFIATMKSGHRGIFVRFGKSRSRKGLPSPSPGLPIIELMGPSIGHIFAKYRPAVGKQAQESFEKNFLHELAFAQSKAQGSSSAGTD